jgi:O-antigen/teichoic acid export membrane protein
MSRARRFFGGLSLGYSYQALVMVIGLWLTPFLLKHLGARDYGLWLIGLQILSYLMLMDFGVIALLPRETAYATGRAMSGTSGDDLSETIGRTARIVLYQTPLVLLGVLIFWLVMPTSWRAYSGPLLVAMLGFALMFPLRIFQAVLQGLQEMPYLGRLQFVNWSVTTALMIVLVLRGFGLYALAVSWVAGQLLPAALSFYRLRTSFPGVLPKGLPSLPGKELFRSLTSGGWVSVSQIAQVLVSGTDYMIIGKLLGPAAVVPYACTQKLISVLANQPYMIMEMAAPGLSQMKTSESRERIFQACAALTLGMLTVAGLIACVALAVNHSFVNKWLGPSQFGGALLTTLLVGGMLLRHWNTTLVYALFALGHQRRISITTLLDGAVTLAAGAALVWWLGPIGMALGIVVGVSSVSLPGNLNGIARELGVSTFGMIASIWSWIWRFAIVASASAIVGLWWRASVLYIGGVACATGAVYCAIMLPMIMDSSLRKYLPARITSAWDTVWHRLTLRNSVAVVQELEVPKHS